MFKSMYIKAQDVKQSVSSPPIENMNQVGNYDTQQISSLINESRDIAIIPSKVAGVDSFSAAAGLYLMLRDKYENKENKKNIKFLYFGDTPEQCKELLKDEDVTKNIQERELLISVDYSETQASKVQYTTENDILYLKLGPIPKHFDTNRIKTKITGFDFDLTFIIGAQELADLGPVYNNLRTELNKSKKINLDNTNKNTRFGIVNLIDDKAESLSHLIFSNAASWELNPSKNAAKALLVGMTYRDSKHS